MSPNWFGVRRAAGATFLWLCVSTCFAGEKGVVFGPAAASGVTSSAPAIVLEPAGGQFIYSTDAHRVRPGQRFAIGSAPRTDFAVFSAEEQVALEELIQKHAADAAAASIPARATASATAHSAPRAVVRHTARTSACAPDKAEPATTAVAWPKVVRDERKVCVPKLEYADQGDWRDHMWCFDKGDGNVR
jgi:hypothetical protein